MLFFFQDFPRLKKTFRYHMKNWKGVFFKYLANVKKGASNHSLYQNVFQGCNLLGKKFFKVPVQIMSLTLFPNKPWFLRKSFENTAGKGEIAHLENFLPFKSYSKLSSANPFSLEASKICRLGKV